jgi:hypothetical protein
LSLNAQISPFVQYDWTIEKIQNGDGSIILADANPDGDFDKMYIWFEDFIFTGYVHEFSSCQGNFSFNDNDQEFHIESYGCAVTPNHTIIANHFVNVFILQEAGVTSTANGSVYGPFAYSFTYSDNGDIVYLHIDNLAGSIATFYTNTLNTQGFLKRDSFIYPNPVSDVIFFQVNGNIQNVKIYDLLGRLVLDKDNVTNNQLDLNDLDRGTYVMKIETSYGVFEEKLVKN